MCRNRITFALAFGVSLLLPHQNLYAQSTPKICYEGYELLGEDNEAALDLLSQCINNDDLSDPARATAHYHRGLAQWHLFWSAKSPDDDQLSAARRDADTAINLKPLYANAYCLRGRIDIEFSLGMNGGDDLEAGRTLGGTSALCDAR